MVYRPPKKSSAGSRFGGPSTDPFAAPSLPSPARGASLPGDDRNLVVVDESYAGGDFEDRLWLFWRKQKTNLLLLFGLCCAGVIGWQGWKIYQQRQIEQLQSAYQKAESGTDLRAFAQAHPDTTLGKLAILQAADAFYKDGKFADAASAYTQAGQLWAAETYGQRARIGLAMSLLRNNDAAGARQQFETLAHDTQSMSYYRSEAAFNLAVLAAQAGNQKDMLQWTDLINSLKEPVWTSEAANYLALLSLPAASSPVLTPATPAPAAANTPAATKPAASAPATAAPAAPAASAKPADTGFDLGPLLKAAGGTN